MTTYLDSTTVKVDGTDLAASGVAVTWEGSLLDAIDDTFDTITYPGVDASDTSSGFVTPRIWTVRCRVRGSDLDDTWTKIRGLRRRTKPGRQVELTRQMLGGETNTIVSLLAPGRRVGDALGWDEADGGLEAVIGIDFQLLGLWHPAAATTIASAAGTQSIAGDVRTHRIVATLSAAAVNPVVANATTGYAFRYVGTVPAGGVAVDVVARTARRLSDDGDVSAALRWSKAAPFRLDPGANVITVSSGTCALDYYPAYQ